MFLWVKIGSLSISASPLSAPALPLGDELALPSLWTKRRWPSTEYRVSTMGLARTFVNWFRAVTFDANPDGRPAAVALYRVNLSIPADPLLPKLCFNVTLC